ncbi:MAG: DEAD/DEAH box helicase family protein [Pseudanabaena sp. M135S2SP2A07QC]|nr:DEAD/DEAH box helicase family protein [Pseudanabaena sp. M179S2SP2A07QC]MCA6531602.1 DEAD/DEAH box helicase family protein [Pseudanabaena sp. M125S2SP2A07QC]MCA6534923.1 DEAD/DEAH box helicase family protein [Pseudanabaena sp. M176S2SP2A07QC]MCA6538444.1 DEAD/DEAH box helicase family protein [Pseudanabaena sp. M037S2SP2A07QC]MCA6542203.1 DEAD/DEAH box helicase family protein [Pseudanabaena sp. M074S1SP2A07QC]MCA6552300.1 DEAD/DEAH box helicase family protein [Pseudanabaena sp. M135S2SP2A07Q
MSPKKIKFRNILGELNVAKLYGGEHLGVTAPANFDLRKEISKIGKAIGKFYQPAPVQTQVIQIPPQLQHVLPNAFCEYASQIYRRTDSQLELIENQPHRIRAAMSVVKILDLVLKMQQYDDDRELAKLRQVLNQKYDAFVIRFGNFTAKVNLEIFKEDPNYYRLRALEIDQGKGKSPIKAPIFDQRTVRATPRYRASNAKDALAQCLDARSFIDLDWIGNLLDKSISTVVIELEGAVFYNGTTPLEDLQAASKEDWITREEFISGNVVARLNRVVAWQQMGVPDWLNVEIYHQVISNNQPVPCLPEAEDVDIKVRCAVKLGLNINSMTPDELNLLLRNTIRVKLGTSWLPETVINEFTEQLLSHAGKSTVKFHPDPANIWVITGDSKLIVSPQNKTEWGTRNFTAIALIDHTLNQKDPKVYDYYKDKDGNTIATLNLEATSESRTMRDKIQSAFKAWIWSDGDRAERLCLHYNQYHNLYRDTVYDGSHLTFPGMTPDFQMRRHQANFVRRVERQKASFAAHRVGYGKTATMIASGMELKRKGMAHKVMHVTMKSILPDYYKEFRRLYPEANILVPTVKEFAKDSRRVLLSKIATHNHDAILLTYEQFFNLPISEETELMFLEEQMSAIASIFDLTTKEESKQAFRSLEATRKKIGLRIQEIETSHRKDRVIYFEQLGIDALFIDEVQQIKRLQILTAQHNVSGIPSGYSQRAHDCFMKVRYLLGNGKRVIYSTGTPLSNTMAEMDVWMRYLQLDLLEEQGLTHFDSFCSRFCETSTALEISPTGRLKSKTRLREFVNLPELMAMWCQVTDIQTAALAEVKTPTPHYHVMSCKPSQEQIAYMDQLCDRAEAVEKRKVRAEVDNMLKITGDGSKSSMHTKLVSPDASEWLDNKLLACAWNVWQIWTITAICKGTQAIFCDRNAPKKDKWNSYSYIRDTLLMLGIPADQIAFIHDYDTDAKKVKLFEAINEGRIRIVFGSTSKLGTGVNMQTKLIALHHIDCPWRPSDLEQREGRGVRQGNEWSDVFIFRYVTEGRNNQAGFDSFLWQAIENKQRMISQVMSGDRTHRTIEDIDETVLNAAQMKAIASGDPLIMERATLEAELQGLGMQLQAYNDTQFRDKSKIQYLTDMVNTNHPANIQHIQSDLATVAKANLKQFISDRGVVLDKAVLIADHISEQFQKLRDSYRLTQIQIGQFAGLNVYLSRFGSEVNGSIGMSISSGYEFNVDCHNPHSSLLHVVRNAIAAKLTTAQETLERDRQELPILQKRVSQPFDQLQTYHEKANRLEFLKQLFDVIANEAPVDNDDQDLNLDDEELTDSREIFWQRDSVVAKLEPPSTAIVEALRQRQFEDWVSGDAENWLEQIAQIVSNVEIEIPVNGDRLLQFLQPQVFKPLSEFTFLERGGKQLVIPQKNVNEEREQLKLF